MILLRPAKVATHSSPTCRRRRTGSVLVMVVIGLTLLLGFVGLAIDSAAWFDSQLVLQLAADQAALAGALKLPDLTAAAEAAALVALQNGVESSHITVSQALPAGSDNPNQYEFVLSRAHTAFFTSVLGLSSVNISVRSLAEIEQGPVHPVFENAIHVDDPSDVLEWSGSNWTVNGDFHSNGEINWCDDSGSGSSSDTHHHSPAVAHGVDSSHGESFAHGTRSHDSSGGSGSGCASEGNTYNGLVGASNGLTGAVSDQVFNGGSTGSASVVTMPALDLAAAALAAKSNGKYFEYDTAASAWKWWNPATSSFENATAPTGAIFSGTTVDFITSGTVVTGPHYFQNGNLKFSASAITGEAWFVSSGTVEIYGNDLVFDGSSILSLTALSSSDAAVLIAGGGNVFNGPIWAPNGGITISGNSNTINGTLVMKSAGGGFSGDLGVINHVKPSASMLPSEEQPGSLVHLVE